MPTSQELDSPCKVLAMNYMSSLTPKGPVRKNDHMWKKPGNWMVKINVDASFQYETLSGACGAVTRDERCDSITAAGWFLPNICVLIQQS